MLPILMILKTGKGIDNPKVMVILILVEGKKEKEKEKATKSKEEQEVLEAGGKAPLGRSW